MKKENTDDETEIIDSVKDMLRMYKMGYLDGYCNAHHLKDKEIVWKMIAPKVIKSFEKTFKMKRTEKEETKK